MEETVCLEKSLSRAGDFKKTKEKRKRRCNFFVMFETPDWLKQMVAVAGVRGF